MKKTALFLIGTIGVVGFFLFSGGASDAVTNLEAEVFLHCPNQHYHGDDAVFVTQIGEPLQVICEVKPKTPPPQGYTPAPVDYQWSVNSGQLQGSGNQVAWSNPAPGVQKIRVSGKLRYLPPKSGFFSSGQPEINIPFDKELAFVVPHHVPKIENGMVNGFRVGEYPDPRNEKDLANAEEPNRSRVRAHPESYTAPELFYEVKPENFFLRVFQNYGLGEFDLDPRFFNIDYPRYVAVHPKILTKLDMLKQLMHENGLKFEKFKFIYFFRCPEYNFGAQDRDGGDTLKSSFSNHMYGQAADMIIDEDDDLIMDDLNGDGRITVEDAKVFLDYVNQLDRKLRDQGSDLIGGAGYYYHHDYYERGEIAQSPYVHMDVRGFTRENGTLIRWGEETDKIGIRKIKDPYRLKGNIPPYPWEKQ